MLLGVADISHVENCAEADILLNAEAPVVDGGRFEVALHGRHIRGAEAERRGQQVVDGRVVRRAVVTSGGDCTS